MAPGCVNAALAAYVLGALIALLPRASGHARSQLSLTLALLGGLLSAVAAIVALVGPGAEWSLGGGLPSLTYRFSLDPLSAFFLLTLSILVLAVAIYSFGYHREPAKRRPMGFACFLLNGLLLSLTIVFTASNAFFFLIGWELMALTAFGLVSFEHQSPDSRDAGLLYLIMAHADAAALLVGFGILGHAAGSLDYGAMRSAAKSLPVDQQSVAFWMFLLGFGIKAGIIPVHIWLPAAHPVAPSNASALLSGIVIKTGIYGMARVFFEFLGDLPLWTGTLVLSLAAVSAILGVLYALMEHDLKRLLAYHSIENIGIILLGFGSALMFRSSGHPNLAALALTAGLFHTLNHAIFKCLLFLGAGAVQHATHTGNMEDLGGLIRRMPVTALCFLVGAVAISGLPPLNGFVSEWLTYQGLLAGFGTTKSPMDLLFPVAGSLLALTGALAAACFVKAFGITFLARPRSEHAAQATEAPGSMRLGMQLLAFACVGLGFGAAWFLPVLDSVTMQLVGATRAEAAPVSWVVSAGTSRQGSVSPGVLGLLMLATGSVAFLWVARRFAARRRVEVPWDCGLTGLGPQHEYTATAFSKPIRMVFAALFQPSRQIEAVFDVSAYFPKEVRFESGIDHPFEERLYFPLRRIIILTASRLRNIQAGSVHLYLAYIFATLIALLVFAVRYAR